MTESEKQIRFMELFQPQYESLWRFTLSLTRNREAARELLADTIAAAYSGFEALKEEKAFLSYLFTIAIRKFKKGKIFSSRFTQYESSDFEQYSNSEQSAEDSYDIQLLREAIEQLPEKEKESILLHEISGFSRKEIAEMHGTTDNTVKSRLARARKRLAKLLGVNDSTNESVLEVTLEIDG